MTTISGIQIRDGTVEGVDLSEEINTAIQQPLKISDGGDQFVSVNIEEVLNLIAGTNVHIDYNDVTNTITINSQDSQIRDFQLTLKLGDFTDPTKASIFLGDSTGLILRKGLESERNTVVFQEGELAYCIDSKKLYVGDDETPGGTLIGYYDHEHDILYYRKDQIDVLLTDFVTFLDFYTHTNNTTIHRQINDDVFNTTSLWSSQKIKNELTSHIHDTRYYRKDEVDSFFNQLSDENTVKVTATDTSGGFLNNKITLGKGLVKTIENYGENEKYKIASSVFLASFSGFPEVAYYDTARSKILSSSIQKYDFSEGSVSSFDWLNIGESRSAANGHFIPFDATITMLTVSIGKDGNNSQSFYLYINNVQETELFSTPGTNIEFSLIQSNLNIDVNAGDKLRIKVGSENTRIKNIFISLYVKWRTEEENVL